MYSGPYYGTDTFGNYEHIASSTAGPVFHNTKPAPDIGNRKERRKHKALSRRK